MKKIFFVLIGLTAVASFSAFKNPPATYTVATDASKIEWTGAKKAGYHTGVFSLKSGSIIPASSVFVITEQL